jgi:hypothetical protein
MPVRPWKSGAFSAASARGNVSGFQPQRVARTAPENTPIRPEPLRSGEDATGDGVYVFAINPSNGALSAVSGSPFEAGIQPWSLAVTGVIH